MTGPLLGNDGSAAHHAPVFRAMAACSPRICALPTVARPPPREPRPEPPRGQGGPTSRGSGRLAALARRPRPGRGGPTTSACTRGSPQARLQRGTTRRRCPLASRPRLGGREGGLLRARGVRQPQRGSAFERRIRNNPDAAAPSLLSSSSARRCAFDSHCGPVLRSRARSPRHAASDRWHGVSLHSVRTHMGTCGPTHRRRCPGASGGSALLGGTLGPGGGGLGLGVRVWKP